MSQHRRRQSEKQDAPGQVVIVGIHPVRVVLESSGVLKYGFEMAPNEHRLRDLVVIAKSPGIHVIDVPSRDFDDAVSSDMNHQGVMALTKAS